MNAHTYPRTYTDTQGKTQAEVKEWTRDFERQCGGEDIVEKMRAYIDRLDEGCFGSPTLAAPDLNPAEQLLLGWHGHENGWYGDYICVCMHMMRKMFITNQKP